MARRRRSDAPGAVTQSAKRTADIETERLERRHLREMRKSAFEQWLDLSSVGSTDSGGDELH
jgi:hypothetical protein